MIPIPQPRTSPRDEGPDYVECPGVSIAGYCHPADRLVVLPDPLRPGREVELGVSCGCAPVALSTLMLQLGAFADSTRRLTPTEAERCHLALLLIGETLRTKAGR